MRFFFAVICLTPLFLAACAPEGDRLRVSGRSYDWKPSATGLYTTVLSASQPSISAGEIASFNIRLENHGPDTYFYNAELNRLKSIPGVFAVFDSAHHYRGDLLEFRGGSFIMDPSREMIPAHGHAVAEISVRVRLEPGRYFLQMIYSKSFASTEPDAFNERDSGESFRSNVVGLEEK